MYKNVAFSKLLSTRSFEPQLTSVTVPTGIHGITLHTCVKQRSAMLYTKNPTHAKEKLQC